MSTLLVDLLLSKCVEAFHPAKWLSIRLLEAQLQQLLKCILTMQYAGNQW